LTNLNTCDTPFTGKGGKESVFERAGKSRTILIIEYARLRGPEVLITESDDGSRTLAKYWDPISRKE